MFELKNIFEWVKYLLFELDQSPDSPKELYKILLQKILELRPYLSSIGERVTNPSLHFEADIGPFKHSLKNYEHFQDLEHTLLHLENASIEFQFEGEIIEVSANYLLTKKGTEIIVYYLGKSIR